MSRAKPGTWVEGEMLNSSAFIALTGFAPQLLMHFLWKRQFRRSNRGKPGQRGKECINCDSLCITYAEAKARWGVSKGKFGRAIDDLLRKGFLTVNHAGGAYKRDKSVYGLSDAWRDWKPGKICEVRKRDIARRGFTKPKEKMDKG